MVFSWLIRYDMIRLNHPKWGMQLNIDIARITFLFGGKTNKAVFSWHVGGTTSTAHIYIQSMDVNVFPSGQVE